MSLVVGFSFFLSFFNQKEKKEEKRRADEKIFL